MKTHTQSVFKAGVVLFIAALFIGTTVGAVNDTTPRLAAKPTTISNIKPADQVELSYYGDIANSIGVTGSNPPFVWKSAIRLTQDEMKPYMKWNLTQIVCAYDAGNGQPECDVTFYIYTKGTETRPGTLLDKSTTAHFNTSDFYTIPLVHPIPLAGNDELWIATEWTQLENGTFIAPCDGGPHVPKKGDFCNLGSGWSELSTYGIEGNWALGGIVEGSGNAELAILNVAGGIGVKADIQDKSTDVDAMNVAWTMHVSGGILKNINVTKTGTITTITHGNVASIGSGFFMGFGKINIAITVSADNAESVSVAKTAKVLIFYVTGVN